MNRTQRTMTPEEEAEWEQSLLSGKLWREPRRPTRELVINHATTTAYFGYGCRCEVCVAFAKSYRAMLKARRKGFFVPEKGN